MIDDINKLYQTDGLKELYKEFATKYRLDNKNIIQKAILIEEFLVNFFLIRNEFSNHQEKIKQLSCINKCKKIFIERIVLKQYKKNDEFEAINNKLKHILKTDQITEEIYSNQVLNWLENREQYLNEIAIAAQYALHMIDNPNSESALFKIPKKLDFTNLITLQRRNENGIEILEKECFHSRNDFQLTDKGFNSSQSIDNTNYCLICHDRDKDTCRSGFKNGDKFKLSQTNVELKGCPLDQKISEMNYLHSQGNTIAALAVITMDNPLCAATGHRICNDCMRSCIYQKQEPVNVPGIETSILDTVLQLPYGFEIYSLLTRWNPLKLHDQTPKQNSGYKILISGLGPAGFTLSHYMLNEGHTVVAVDGAKIEPLPPEISGVATDGNKAQFKAIKNINDIYEKLNERIIHGFGGVAEYGITVRWNKNYLKIIRILLERRENFHMFGGVRFGSNINFSNAMDLNFNHIALCVGAGKPNLPSIKNVLSRGVRFASDFLMNLQLGGAFKEKSITNLQIRMPIIVIGAGLTAVDTATESLTYYKIQVEKFSLRYKKLYQLYGKDYVEQHWNQEDKIIATEFLNHAEQMKKCKNSTEFLKKIGGVKILYRKKIQDSPAYKINYEELQNGFHEGIEFLEDIEPVEIICDQFGSAEKIKCIYKDSEVMVSARTILIAAGTKPNTIPLQEYKNNAEILDKISIFGDLDKKYSGSVVSAMASAKDQYKKITEKISTNSSISDKNFPQEINNLLRAKVLDVNILTDKIFEIIVYSPLAVTNFKPGQFYKLQNFETNTDSLNKLIEPIALTGAKVDKKNGTISLIVLHVGASSYLCKFLKKGEYIVLMGPTGSPTEIPYSENVLLIGGGLGNAVLFSIAKAMKENNCRVTYFAGYKKTKDRFKQEEIESSADKVVWICDESHLTKNRDQDETFQGNMIIALEHYSTDFSEIDRILTIGSDSLMHAVQVFIKNNRDKFKALLKALASINSPMQCMMKEICGQCIQKNTINNNEEYIYSCNTQDQNIFSVDFEFLNERLAQNSLLEKLTTLLVENNRYF
jgi:NADPH-dependent glutamate synthase beta subunit-like oxidoreductase/NAD(P)H-flavin reductase